MIPSAIRRPKSGFNERGRDRWVLEQARAVAPGSRILDVGAGSGPYRHLFDHCAYRAHDFGQESSTEYTDLDFVSDILSIPAPDGAFDALLCTEVLEHVPQPIAALGEMHRLLRPGGTLLLTAPLGSVLHQEPCG